MNSNKVYTVYMHVNKVNGKRYVGITNQEPKYRWRSNGGGYFRSPHFWAAIQKYGWDNFEHIILETGLDRASACEHEKRYISEYNTRDKQFGYNMTDGGDGSCGWSPSVETLKRRSEKLRGVTRTDAHKEAIRKANTGRKISEETRQRLRDSHIGKKLSGYCLEMARNRLKEFHKHQRKNVFCIDEQGNIFEFDSISDAADYFNEPILKKSFKTIAESGKPRRGRTWHYKEVV